jgi:MFS family permease
MATLTVIAVSAPDMATGKTWNAINNWAPPIVSLVCAVAFFAAYKSLGRPMFVFLLGVMILLATTELGVDGWVTDLMTPAFGKFAGWLLVYTSAIMFVLRFFAGPIVHRISPLGLLATCAAIAAVALFILSSVGDKVALVILAATLYGMGKSFFWPTTLGVVSEQFPKGGALTLSAMGGMGMIAVGVLGGPFLGALLDNRLDTRLDREAPAIHAVVSGSPTTNYGMTYKPVNQGAIKGLPQTQQDQFTRIQGETKQGTLATIAILPTIMFLCYLSLILYFKSKGGYAVEHLTMTGEQAAGGIQAPVEA